MPSILIFLFLLSPVLAAIGPNSPSNASIYDVLRGNGLPMGILPKGITDFSIDEATGRFEVYLTQACNAKFESELHYERNVSGTISYGQIGSLNGISAQDLFLWFPVKGIRVDVPSSGIIYFDVGVVFKQFTLSMFEIPRDCTACNEETAKGVADGKLLSDSVSNSLSEVIRSEIGGQFGGKSAL